MESGEIFHQEVARFVQLTSRRNLTALAAALQYLAPVPAQRQHSARDVIAARRHRVGDEPVPLEPAGGDLVRVGVRLGGDGGRGGDE